MVMKVQQVRKGYYPETMVNIDKLASEFANVFNAMHKQGFDFTGAQSTLDFFEPIDNTKPLSAGNIKVNDALIKDSSKLAASSGANEEGNGKWALELSNIQSKVQANLDGATFNSFYQGIIGKLGVDGEEAARLNGTSETLLVTLGNNRAAITSVSLDEEMTNMITFQQAYNANARMITVIDETLDKIINGMGRVGI
ncbi:Flagellar hook-associated protein 1 OS=Lysinibacillus sphaericus OX=1421 GN=flgK PE=3 SV=1 [Lysinibacillus sphaericus]